VYLAGATALVVAILGCGVPLRSSAAAQVALAGAAAPPELPTPPEVSSVNGVAKLQLTAALDAKTNLPTFVYAGQTVPPTIRVWPGDTLVIDYTNALPARNAPPLDMTNLHTHGLMDSPKAPGDQVIMTMIAPGQTYRYVYAIPKNQPPGLYWYHPHPHGESNHQVASGMSGLIVVQGIETYAPVVRGLPERDILLRDYYFDPGDAPQSRFRRHAQTRRAPASAWVPDCAYKDASDGVTINGVKQATITMAPGSRQFFRIANTSANSFFDLRIPGQKLYVVAYDGVPLSFHNRAVEGEWLDHVLIPPAGRAEVVVSAPAASGTPFETGCVDTGPDGDVDPGRKLADVNLGTPPATIRTAQAARPAAPEPFGPIGASKIAAYRTVVFSENNPASEFYINRQLWNPAAPPMFTVQDGTVERWTLYNYATEAHVFHIHQIHFVVEAVNGVKAPPSMWRDTFAIPYATIVNGHLKPGIVHLLMDFRDPNIVGTFVFHCHILEHEDYGMMAKIRVAGPVAPAGDLRGFKEGYLKRTLPAICKLQTAKQKFCGCDQAGHTVSFLAQQG
jgi:FtsP/CotA-like multicopper oxidase with cupredoxin domain